MKFFLDHDVPAEVGRVLRQVGHEVIELRKVLPVHASDFEVLEYACEHGSFLVTCNRDDFLALAANHPNPGIIILVRRRSRHAECGHLLAPLSAGKGFVRVVLEEIQKTVFFEVDCTLNIPTGSQMRALKNLAANFKWRLVDDTTQREIDLNEPFAAIIASLKEGQNALTEFPANTWKNRFGAGR